MLKLIIEDDEGRKTVVPFVRDEITIGRQEGNTIRLTERNVSRRHARLVRLNGHVVVEDLGSYNGTRINGERIAGQSPLKEGDLIQIGDYDLALQAEGAASVSGPITTKVPSALRKTEPVLEPMGGEQDPDEEREEEDEASAAPPADDPDAEGAGDEHDHTPPSSAEVRRHSTSIIRLDQVEADRPRKVVDVAAEDAPRLLVLTPDELKGQEFACIRTELRIGRTDDNDITLDHRSLSRTHAKLVREDTGEWRVIDMQSANGLTVNGESYAQATLGSGDIIELGHVKLRFLNAGDAADDQPADEGGSRSKLPLVAGLVALLLGGAAAGVYFLRSEPAAPVNPVAHQEPEPEQPATGGTEPVNIAKPPPEAPPEAPPEPTGTTLAQRLDLARKAIDAREFDKAEDILSNAKDAQGKRPAEADALLDTARSERMVEKRLAAARTALAAGNLSEAGEALDASSGTRLFADEHAKLLKQWEEANKKEAPPPPTPPPAAVANTNAVVPPSSSPPEPAAEQPSPAQQALAEGKKNLAANNNVKAIENLRKCIDLDAELLDCYAYLGSALAKNAQYDEGAEYYRLFLKKAPPDNPRVKNVKKILEGYEKQK
ncbi:FHA domain-containing protein [Pyxidicoccus parkwayensis]|uniref:FHA domain-containing protein n=1 Tax=Pyxidicoccus parkwayensis TaxID=2813578 RepID=A0ABX7P010_9BACT|nr:FHA domain-containing protein [Pyxidicoccus parkwaysis]QSQ24058.1 FHA domain-containing protein [Pyxidicoccus parkwaysis]